MIPLDEFNFEQQNKIGWQQISERYYVRQFDDRIKGEINYDEKQDKFVCSFSKGGMVFSPTYQILDIGTSNEATAGMALLNREYKKPETQKLLKE